MQKYSIGFAFNEAQDSVILIEKNRPDWQAGKLNGVGGHVEPGEDPWSCMNREFIEETGAEADWVHKFTFLHSDRGGLVFVYKAEMCQEEFDKAHTTTDEEVVKVRVDELLKHCMLSNLYWIIPMLLDNHGAPFMMEYRNDTHMWEL